MRKQLLTAATATTASFIAVIGGLTPAVSAESPIHQPELEIHIPTVETVPEPVPVPVPQFNPELLGSLDLVHPTIPEDPPVPPADDDGPFPFNPDFELCLIIDRLCPPDIDDFLPPLPGDDDPGDDDPGDDQPGDDDPGDNPGDDDQPGDTPTDDPGDTPTDTPTDDPGDTPTDDPGDTPTDDPEVPEGEVPEGNSVPTDIDEPVPGNPSFTG